MPGVLQRAYESLLPSLEGWFRLITRKFLVNIVYRRAGCETFACWGVTCWENVPGIGVVAPPPEGLFVAPVSRDAGAARSANATRPPPDTTDQLYVKDAGGLGRPSSVALPERLAAEGRVIV